MADPAGVLVPENTSEVAAALGFAREQGLPLSVRSGGHGLSGRSSTDGGVVIDLSTLVNLLPDDRSLVASITAVVADGSERRPRRAVEPLLRIGATLDQHAEIIPYSSLMSTAHLHANVGQQPTTTTNGLLTAMTDQDAATIAAVMRGPHQPTTR